MDFQVFFSVCFCVTTYREVSKNDLVEKSGQSIEDAHIDTVAEKKKDVAWVLEET